MNTNETNTINKAQELRDRAARREEQAKESFDRCDTDGFVSQWAHGVLAQEDRLQAQIEENGGVAEFDALFHLDGRRARAKLIDGRYGECWAFCDADGRFTGKFISAFPKRESTMARKGFREGKEQVPARAKLVGSGTGLAAACSVRAIAVRLDDGYPADAE